MELNRELCASRRELSQQSWQDDSFDAVCLYGIVHFNFLDALAPRRDCSRGATSVASLLPFLLPLLLPKFQLYYD